MKGCKNKLFELDVQAINGTNNLQPVMYMEISKFHIEILYMNGSKRITAKIRNTYKCCEALVKELPQNYKYHICSTGTHFLNLLELLLSRDMNYFLFKQPEE
ncbi:MAG: hypothetical protein A2309_02770 [Bacteroidetes bacterium RIFOXYB2_FULL_35_7]|nr:MAG: hypothetical protein A2X01_08385 [Bacteroidetes bacterium GWF2_35_48]OFY93449.1 MAG: hypothetical protein A2309_02770 [Bacteroidetes bacterium RIFOXYB2_FULL_35_7]HBX50841.1 hypothetical protein [Bacteroidales bacterium]